MRSKASLRSHPIHPALIPFPLAFLIGGWAFDVAGKLLDKPDLWQVAFYLTIAGVGMALIAAVPGFIDYFYTVPPRSSGKKRATKHMLANLTVVVLFAAAWTLRDSIAAPSNTILVLESLGAALLVYSGWLGGVLVSRNMISVDHRYADAGRWKDLELDVERPLVVAGADELAVNQMKLVRVNGKRIAIGRTEQGYVAFDDHCTHRGGSLAGGVMICGTVQCLWHGSQFDVRSGKVKSGPAKDSIATYQIEEHNSEIILMLGRKS